MSQVKEFKTESQKLLNLMVNSIYANSEIFLRELISNASDAIDKYHYLSLSDDSLARGENYEIHLEADEKQRILKITDNGIGMTEEEINNNLGTIARSGSKEFMKMMQGNDNIQSEIDIIGQFGVGFYSAFMVAKEVVVETKSPYASKGYRFTSSGESTYEIEEIEKSEHGSCITLYLRDDNEEQTYSHFLDKYTIKRLVKKYSDYVRYPITMIMEKYQPKYDENGEELAEREPEFELETLNSMIPIWKRNKSQVSDEELNEFYKQKFNDYNDPLMSIFISVEGSITYNALVFIPKKAPYDLYTDKFEKGLQLYTKGVFIMDKCKELIPDYFRYARGLVDSSDLSLNISREILQQNKQLEKIANNIEKKIIAKLEQMQKEDNDKYLEFFETYGRHLKFGVYADFGAKKELLENLLVYSTINEEKMISLATYIDQMPEEQKYIYYASGKNKESIMAMPQMDAVKKKGYNVLILTDDVDEFAIRVIDKYKEIEFQSISQGELDLLDEETIKEVEQKGIDKKILLDALKEALQEEVKEVRLSRRLTDSPVCLVSGDGLSFEMEKVLSTMPDNDNVKADRILEINPNHQILETLEDVYVRNIEEFNHYAKLLYAQALLMEGFEIPNKMEFSKMMCDLMIKKA